MDHRPRAPRSARAGKVEDTLTLLPFARGRAAEGLLHGPARLV
jgi:hypothetical protein